MDKDKMSRAIIVHWIGTENAPITITHDARNGMTMTVPEGWVLEASTWGEGRDTKYVSGTRLNLCISKSK